MRIAIAGVGVAGGVLAMGLARIPGVEVLAFERVGPRDHALAGNGLNVGPNAMLALERALPDMAARLRELSLPWRQWRASTMQGEPLYEVPLPEVAACDGIRIRWADLYQACRDGAGDAVRYDAQVLSVGRPLPGQPLSLHVRHADGHDEHVDGIDLLVAADGRYSALRQQLCGTPPVTHLGVGNFRVLLEDGGAWPIDDLQQWFNGPARLLAFRLRGGLVYLSGNIPIAAGHDIPPERKTSAWLEQVYTPADGRKDEAARALLQGACDAARDGRLHWSRLQEAPTCWHDESGRVLFPGDAGHPMVPTLGQGATTAIEDAAMFVLAIAGLGQARGDAASIPPFVIAGLTRNPSPDRCLPTAGGWVPGQARDDTAVGDTAVGDTDVPSLVRAYAAQRSARIDFIRRFSWEASDVLVEAGDHHQRVRAKGGADYRAKLSRLYGLD